MKLNALCKCASNALYQLPQLSQGVGGVECISVSFPKAQTDFGVMNELACKCMSLPFVVRAIRAVVLRSLCVAYSPRVSVRASLTIRGSNSNLSIEPTIFALLLMLLVTHMTKNTTIDK